MIRLLLLVLSLATPSVAQDVPTWEFFAGYSFQRSDVREYFKTTPIIYTFRHHYVNLNGWELSLTENRNRWFGGTLDLSGYYKTPEFRGAANRERMYSILYGPRFSYRRTFVTPFAHVLAGAARTSVKVVPVGPRASDFSFAMAVGGGLDLTLKNRAAIRLFQADYLRTNALESGQNNYRASTGMIFYLGKRN